MSEIMQLSSVESHVSPARRLYVLLHALAFVSGFSLVFVVGWGGGATLLGQIFRHYQLWIARIGGAVLIVFGLASMDVIRIPWFYMDTRPEYKGKTGTFWGSFAMGIFFAAGWTPCIGATLGAILTLGMGQQDIFGALALTFGYSLGMGIPFLLLGYGMDRSVKLFRRLGKYIRTFQIVSGVLVILIGVLMITSRMSILASLAESFGLYLDPFGGKLSFLIAMAAGMLSFLSPCVLPLVPAYLAYLGGHAVAAARQE